MEIDASVRSVVLDAIANGVVVIDAAGRVLVWNRWMVRHSGIPEDIAIGRHLVEIFPEIARTRLDEAVKMALSHRLAALVSPSVHFPFLPLYRHPADREPDNRMQQLINITPIKLSGAAACTLQVQDVTAAVLRERRLREQASALAQGNAALQLRLDEILALQKQVAEMRLRDPLTGLFNPTHMRTALEAAVTHAQHGDAPLALVLLDVDGLKLVNEMHGRPAGDDVLKAVGALLSALLPASGIAGRHGGDEFLVLLPATPPATAKALVDAWWPQFVTGERPLKTTLSAGIAVCPAHGRTAEELVQCANLALFLAKHDGRNRAVVFDIGA